ncbi:MAG: hypothetical protein ACPGSD_16850 [Flavobacteriales bacterium]
MYKKLLYQVLFVGCIQVANSQIGIGTLTPDNSAILDVYSTEKGFLPPRLNSDANVANPTEGLVIYDESDNCINVYNGGSWVDLCANVSSPSTPSLFASNCEGVFNNISTFGTHSYNTTFLDPSYDKFNFHLNEDGSVLYNNQGLYYDTLQMVNTSLKRTNKTSQVVALEQNFPGVKWKNFIAFDTPNAHEPDYIYLLSKTGELFGMYLHESMSSIGQNEKPGTHISNIDPSNDNKVIIDPNQNTTLDFLYDTEQYLANGVDANIKFNQIYSLISKSGANGNNYTILAYDQTNEKFYSMGTNYTNSRIHSRGTRNSLFRDEPATLKESFNLKEATDINNLLKGLNISFNVGDGNQLTLLGGVSSTSLFPLYFLTSDGYVNVLQNKKFYRYEPLNGVKIVALTDNFSAALLGEDGNLYSMSTISTAGAVQTSITEGGQTYDVYTKSLTPFTVPPTLSSVNIKTINKRKENGYYHIVDSSDKLYLYNLMQGTANYGLISDYSTEFNLGSISRIISSVNDIIVQDENGHAILITRILTPGVLHNNKAYDNNKIIFNDQVIDIDGLPKTISETPFRVLNGCFGNN